MNPNDTIVNSATENTGDFESYSGPRRWIGGNGDTAQAERNSADFGTSTGDFQSATENSRGSYGPAGAGSQSGAPGASQPSSMGSNADSEFNQFGHNQLAEFRQITFSRVGPCR
jgi:hypothetical protein